MIKQNLTFAALRKANTLRLPQFKNARGAPAHTQPDGSDWSPGEWMNAILGELGEAANIVKKIKRGDMTLDAVWDELANEFADVVTYADITAFQLKMELTHYRSFDEVREKNHRNNHSLGELMNSAFGHFGDIAGMVDYRNDRSDLLHRSPTVSDSFHFAIMAIDRAAALIHLDLGNVVVEKFNTVSKRVRADVFINTASEVVNHQGDRL